MYYFIIQAYKLALIRLQTARNFSENLSKNFMSRKRSVNQEIHERRLEAMKKMEDANRINCFKYELPKKVRTNPILQIKDPSILAVKVPTWDKVRVNKMKINTRNYPINRRVIIKTPTVVKKMGINVENIMTKLVGYLPASPVSANTVERSKTIFTTQQRPHKVQFKNYEDGLAKKGNEKANTASAKKRMTDRRDGMESLEYSKIDVLNKHDNDAEDRSGYNFF